MTVNSVRIGVIQFPGSNCERETAMALKRAGCEPVDFLWSESPTKLDELDGYVIVGGFSYEDRVRSGLIAAQDPILQALKAQTKRGKPLLGICNGAQILVESGLVPGLPHHEVAIALTQNRRMCNQKLLGVGFYNEWVYIKAAQSATATAFSTPALAQQPIHVPIAHAEGRFLLSPELYHALQKTQAVFYYYCTAQGEIAPEFPVNPNGSFQNLAAIGNVAGNVLAMMPHPERTSAGDAIFIAMRHSIEKCRAGFKLTPAVLDFPAPRFEFKGYPPTSGFHLDYWISLKIQDNEALTLQNTLHELGAPVTLRKLIHWQVMIPKKTDLSAVDMLLRNNELLFNPQKEQLCDLLQSEKKWAAGETVRTYVIRAHEDEQALAKTQQLKNELPNGFSLIRETIWQVRYAKRDEAKVIALLEHSAILGNPLAHAGFIL